MKLSLVNLVPLEEMDMNDPVMMRARAVQMKADKEAKRKANRIDGNEAMYLRGEIADLKDEIKQIYIDMEQEAEPEGGPIANMYGNLLNKAEAKLADMQSKLDDYDMNEGLNEEMGEWPKELTSKYSDEYRFELEKVTPTYQDKPGRAKYRVIDIESGELKGTPVFGKIKHLMAYAGDLIKPQGGTQSSNFGESLEEVKAEERFKVIDTRTGKVIDNDLPKKLAQKLAAKKKEWTSYPDRKESAIAKIAQTLDEAKIKTKEEFDSNASAEQKAMEKKWDSLITTISLSKSNTKQFTANMEAKQEYLTKLNNEDKLKKKYSADKIEDWSTSSSLPGWKVASTVLSTPTNEGSCGYGPNGKPGNTPGGTRGMSADDRTRGMFRTLIQKEIAKLSEKEGVKHYTKDGKEWTGATHKMPNGKLMTQDPHREDSEELFHKEDLEETSLDYRLKSMMGNDDFQKATTPDMPEATKVWDRLVQVFSDNKNDSISYLNSDPSYRKRAITEIFRAMNF